MRGFLERQMQRGAAVEVYELAPWGPKAWEEIAWLELEQGRDGAKCSKKVVQFVSALQASPTLADLARLPFYCTVMLDAYRAGKGLPKDELELLQSIVDRMVEREHGKDLFRWRDFVDLDALCGDRGPSATRRAPRPIARIRAPSWPRCSMAKAAAHCSS